MMNRTALLLLTLLGPACSRDAASAGRAKPEAAPTTTSTAQSSPPSEHCARAEPLEADDPLPGKSLYHLQVQLTDQTGATRDLGAFRGRPVLVTMFYSSCTSICPMLIGQVQRIEAALEPEMRARMRVLLISLDPQRDTTERLAELAKRHGVAQPRWSFTRTSEPSVREVAALLGIRYRSMPDGEISHSPVIALLDPDGVLVTRIEGGLADPSEMASAIRRLLSSPDGA